MNDMALGRLQMLLDGEGAPEAVDYEWYYRQYQGVLHVLLFIEWLMKFVSKDEEEKEVEAPTPEAPADDFTFGGDYASQDSP